MRRLVALLIVASVWPAASSAVEPDLEAGTESALVALAADLALHPSSQPADIYKFLHQALFGPGHAVPDAEAASAFLEDEIAGLASMAQGEPWCAPLGGKPALVRVNLRPFASHGFDREVLLEAFFETATQVRGDPVQMKLALAMASQWLRDEHLDAEARALQQLARDMEREGFPAVHHSETYREAYDPAYRVVTAAAASEHGWCGALARR